MWMSKVKIGGSVQIGDAMVTVTRVTVDGCEIHATVEVAVDAPKSTKITVPKTAPTPARTRGTRQ